VTGDGAGVLQALRDFLWFDLLVTPQVLVGVYWIGALLIAFGVFRLSRRLHRQLLQRREGVSEAVRLRLAPARSRAVLYAVSVFVFAELGWRMLFEFLVAYFRIHDALVRLTPPG
jgi:hypothetical protein